MNLKSSIDDLPLFYDDEDLNSREFETAVLSKLDQIIEKLDQLKACDFTRTQPDAKITESAQPAFLRAPSNATPKGSMLGEIQSVLAAQLVANQSEGNPSPDNIVDSSCSLASSVYDDNI